MKEDLLTVQKLSHPIKLRRLTVKRITELTPSLRRITLTGDDLEGFLSASFDDHVKLIVPVAAGQEPNMPTLGEKGLVFDENRPRPAMRDYTPRRYNAAAQELDIDFVLHHDGPATVWATHAQVGHPLGIAGPRGSFVVPTDFDWHLLIGDETALPAISRRLEELPSTAKAIVVIKTTRDDGQMKLASDSRLEVHWVTESNTPASGPGALEAAVRHLSQPQGEGYIWAGGEYEDIKAVRQFLIDEWKIDKSRIRASSYWRRAAPNTHKNFD